MKHTHPRTLRRYEPLSRLGDYRIEPHQPDPRGWKVVSPDGRTVGEVKDLIVDTERMRVRYLDVAMDASLFDRREDPHVLVPVEQARRDGTHHRLIADGLSLERVSQLSEARARHLMEFWDRWWSGDALPRAADTPVHPAAALPDEPRLAARTIDQRTAIAGAVPEDALRRALEDVKPGEQVRIPVVEEEIVVERRPVSRH